MSRAKKKVPAKSTVRCAIYTRKSSEEGLDQEFNSLDAQREAAESFIASQKAEGWTALPDRYDDGGYSGGSIERPGLERLLRDINAGKVDCVVVYKVDRLSRSLMDFARIMETFERGGVSFVSVTQARERAQAELEAEQALIAARREWEAAIAEAKGKRPSEGVGDGSRIPGTPDLTGLSDLLEREAAKIGVRGTFNSAAIQGLMTDSGVAERTAKATEDTARNTKRIERAINDNAIAFA